MLPLRQRLSKVVEDGFTDGGELAVMEIIWFAADRPQAAGQEF